MVVVVAVASPAVLGGALSISIDLKCSHRISTQALSHIQRSLLEGGTYLPLLSPKSIFLPAGYEGTNGSDLDRRFET